MIFPCIPTATAANGVVGREVSVSRHLADGEEYNLDLTQLLRHGELLFKAAWTRQEGGGRPETKGTGSALSDPTSPLQFPRNMNRVSGPDANACSGCHNAPIAGGGGDFVTNVFVLGQRFDFASFDGADSVPDRGTVDENGQPVTLQSIANSRSTPGMFGSGYIEMLARQLTRQLQAARDGLAPGQSVALDVNGLSFGTLARRADGSWDVSRVEGLPPTSLVTTGVSTPPSLIVCAFHQAGFVISLRQFTNNALNHHHGIQPTERFGTGIDPDGDGVTNELTRADVTALTVFQAAMAVPVRVIPRDRTIEQAIARGEQKFVEVGCSDCHVPALPLTNGGWIFTEPNPDNPVGNLRPQDVPSPLALDLNGRALPKPRLAAKQGVTWVPAFTDLKLHDITSGPNDPNREPVNMQFKAGSPQFLAGNSQFLTRKLWGAAAEPPYFHHGLFTTLRDAVEAHAGEAAGVMARYRALSSADQDAVIELLKTFKVAEAPVGTLFVDEAGRPRSWRPFPYDFNKHLGAR